jgi:hypothetical protein
MSENDKINILSFSQQINFLFPFSVCVLCSLFPLASTVDLGAIQGSL